MHAGLNGTIVPRTQQRLVDQRSEPRRDDLVEAAMLSFRGGEFEVRVVNVSSRGAMIETALMPRIGEPVIVRFDGCTPIHAYVRWIRDGRLGLNFGCEMLLG